MRFPSRIDLWLLLVLAGSALVVLWALGRTLLQGDATAIAISLVGILVGAGLPLWILLDTRYEIADGHLLVRCGPLRRRIALDQIRSVKPSRSMVSSPALSLDRVSIAHGRSGAVLISPKDKAGFIAALQQQAPGVQVLHS